MAVALCIRKYVSDGALLKQNPLEPSLPTGVIVAESYTRAREALADLLRCDGHRAFEANAETALFAIPPLGFATATAFILILTSPVYVDMVYVLGCPAMLLDLQR